MSGRIAAMNAYLSNEPFLLKKLNWPYVVFSPQQFGMDFYSDVLFTSRAVEKANPGAVAAFRTATLKGWEYALAHREEIISLILAQYNTQDKGRYFLTFEANTLADLIDADVIQLGHSNPGRWRRIVETYAKFGIIKFDYNLDDFFYNPNPPPPDLTWLYQLAAAVLSVLGLIALVVLYVHRLNRTLRRANEVCEQTLDEKRQFMDMLTHELKTPISVVTLTLGQMTDESTGKLVKNRAARALDAITSIVERCQQLDQLEHRTPSLKRQECDLAEVVNQLKSKSPDPQRLVCAQESLPIIACDLQLLNIILDNLVINAYMYSAPRSAISLSVLPLDDAGVHGIQISIENMPGSAGMPDPSKVFTKYYRSAGARAQTGSGLGLYLAHSFTTLLGGKISFATDSGYIRFTLWLPT
jgi:signal transduction histidine kinase